LLAADAIHPLFDTNDPPSPLVSEITVVIPSKDTPAESLNSLVQNLPPVKDIIIIDDGSAEPITGVDRATVHRLPTSRGPAGARNMGLSLVTTPLVCFIDSDIELSSNAAQTQFWNPVLAHFQDPRIGLVAPRVQSSLGTTFLERYEMTDSPLDMGLRPARLHPMGRISYVPSAFMLARTDELRHLGGFDESLRYGEDVDLVWRLVNRGVVCRYEPRVTAHHHPRSTWLELARQRFLYGTSAARLDARHPGNLAPLRLEKWTSVAWGSAVFGHPFVAALITGISALRLRNSLPSNDPHNQERDVIASRLVLRGNLLAGRALTQAMNRTWWPLLTLAAVASRRARWLWMSAIVISALEKWLKGTSDLDPVRYTGARVFDDLSYGAGVWAGVVKTRRVGPLLPLITLGRSRPL
jgi:mycofactocin system glycosyltransferase